MKTDGSDREGRGRSKGELVKSPVQALKDMMNTDYVKRRFAEVMGKNAPAFIASVLNAVQKNPDLARCEPQSVLSSAMVAATLDLPIDSNLGFADIVPYNTKRKDPQTGKEYWVSLAQFQIMYKGFVQLALRTGQYKTINISPIYEDEFDSYDIVTGEVFMHPVDGGYREQEIKEKIIGYVAFFRLLNGYERMEYWPLKKIEAHGKKYSKSYDKSTSLWKKDPHVMYAKTVLKNTLSKWGILSVSMQTALVADQAVIKEFDKPIDGDNVNYIDNHDSMEVSPEPIEPQESTGDAQAEKPEPESTVKQKTVKDTTPTKEAKTPNESGHVTKGKTGESLFSPEESDALEEQYQRQIGGVEPPDFH
ncbi:MAG: recombinase RecT [Treponema sp.]|nr:recombinase RecT [Treponema sp.]